MCAKTPISTLQELMAARGHPLPYYEEEGFGTNFKCTVFVEDISAIGHGTSKKSAKHECAQNALNKLEISVPVISKELPVLEKPLKNFVGELNEYSSKNGLLYPSYEFVTATVNGTFVFKCRFMEEVAEGRGRNKKDAKQDAARNMLKQLDRSNPAPVNTKFKIGYEKTVVETEDADMIISMFNTLSVSRKYVPASSTTAKIEPAPGVKIEEEDSIEDLEKQLSEFNIRYTVTDFQRDPYVVCLIIKDTHFTFLAAHDIKEEALKKAYKNVLEVKKSGCSLGAELKIF